MLFQSLLKSLMCVNTFAKQLFISGLESVLQRIIYSTELKKGQVEVFDIVGVSRSRRFQVVGGLMAHNCLGIQYLMAKYSLQRKLTLDTGVEHTVEEAEALIDLFDNVFSDYSEYRTEIVQDYKYDGYLRLSDGWTMFGDNDNHRSVANCPTQGSGSVVLRRMVKYLQEAGLIVVKTLHDAGYCKIPLNDWDQVDLMADCMQRAFQDSFSFLPKNLQKYNHIRLDTDAWGEGINLDPDFTTPKGLVVKRQETYVDGRGINQYNKFSKYFNISLASMEDAL